MVVDGDGKNFFRMVLIYDVFVEIFLYHVRLCFLKRCGKRIGKILLLMFGSFLFVSFEEMIYVFNTVFADGKTGLRVEDRHIILVLYRYEALAEAADVLHRCFWHIFPSMWLFLFNRDR